MKKVYLAQIENGSPIQMDLFNAHGAVLVPKGRVMTPKLRQQLLRNSIEYFLVEVTGYERIEDYYEHFEESVIQQIEAVKKVYNDSFTTLSSEFEGFKRNRNLDKKVMRETAKELVASIEKYQHVYLGLEGIRRKDFYTYIHSVDVAIFMIVMGKSLKMERKTLEEAALAGLLHDIGKTEIDDAILLKPSKLTDTEMKTMKNHTIKGYEILKHQMHYPEDIARVAREHHERKDCQGYPENKDWTQVHLYSRMAAICDIYDAITGERVYKKAMLPHDAVEYLMTLVNGHLDKDLTTQFIRNIAVYPMGTKVKLNNGEIGIVIKLHHGYPTRPVVKILEKSMVRDLLKENTLLVEDIIHQEQKPESM